MVSAWVLMSIMVTAIAIAVAGSWIDPVALVVFVPFTMLIIINIWFGPDY
jgi:hypothetical protein